MDDLFPVTLDEQIAEVQRELDLRRRVYELRVGKGRLSARAANQQIRRMEAVLETLLRLQETE